MGCVMAGLVGEFALRLIYPEQLQNVRLDQMPFQSTAMLRHLWVDAPATVGIRKHLIPINRHGYRGADFEFAKPEGRIRIVVYGGSQVFDQEVGGFDDWPHRLGELLREAGYSVEVINGGIPGNVSWESTAWLLGEGWQLNPDIVVLCHGWNELQHLGSTRPLARSSRPFDRRDNPHMYSQNAVDRTAASWSALYRAVRYVLLTRKLGVGREGARTPEAPTPAASIDVGLKRYRLHTRQFIDLARSIGAVPVLLEQVRLVAPDNGSEARAKILYDVHDLEHEELCRRLDHLDAVRKAVAAETGARWIQVPGISGRTEYFYDHIHLSDAGSTALAEALVGPMVGIIESLNPKVPEREEPETASGAPEPH
jgi:lysophospholipase L1-like esterase